MKDVREWTEDETTRAIGMFRAKISAIVIAERLGRTEASVRHKLKRLGVHSNLTAGKGKKKGRCFNRRATQADINDFLGGSR